MTLNPDQAIIPERGGHDASPAAAVDAGDPVWAERLAALDRTAVAVAEAIAADGGSFEIVAVLDDGTIRCRLAGACGTCAVAISSTASGLERILTDRFDWITGVEVVVDSTGGYIEGVGGWTPKL